MLKSGGLRGGLTVTLIRRIHAARGRGIVSLYLTKGCLIACVTMPV